MGMAAQKKQLSQARDNIKEGKNLDKVEASMWTLLKDSALQANVKMWVILTDALKAQYEQGNEKLYLKQNYDTAALFNTTKRLFTAMEGLDSVDMQPDKKGRVEFKYRQRNAQYLNSIRLNLFNGGAYFVRKQNYQEAQTYFEQYLDCARQPLFEAYDYSQRDANMPRAAYWAMYCAYKEQNASLVLHYNDLAQKDTAHLSHAIQFEAEAYRQLGDTTHYVGSLKRGFSLFPKDPFFFTRLIEYYEREDLQDSAMHVADKALAVDSANVLFRLAKSTILLNMGLYDECIALCKPLVEENDSLADAYYNMGLAYFNKAITLDKVRQNNKKMRQQTMAFYEQSRPCIERYRALEPDKARKWIAPLYTIYLNLNMGKEFDEIDKLRNEYRRNHQ